MPCFRCAARQTDPVRGASPWRRGVAGGEQVLICPDCQRAAEWAAGLDSCQQCASTALVRELGDVRCRECGAVTPADSTPRTTTGDAAAGLAAEVTAALARRFGSGGELSGS